MAEYRTRVADLIAARLYEAGCRNAYGIPGGEVLTLVDALERAGLKFHLAKHENCAGFMAEGDHHVTGAPGVLVATLGPGAANAVNVVANALQDRVPMIVLTGCVDAEEALSYTHQVTDQQALFESITKASFRASELGADLLIDKAVSIALSQRPGPVHIDLPIAVAAAVASPGNRPRHAPVAPVAPAHSAALEEARAWLREAERPIVVAGLDIMTQGADGALRDFVESCGAPLITTYKAKGVLPEDHPLSLGGAGLSPTADKALLPLVAQSDLVVLAGYDPIEMRSGWRDAWDPRRQRVVELAVETNHQGMHQAEHAFVCDLSAGLAALSEGHRANGTWPGGEPDAAKQEMEAAYAVNETWGPAAIVRTARQVLPRDAIATVDSGAHRILLSQVWDCYLPRGLLQSTGFCTMGCALPLAIGAKRAAPDRPLVAFTGDAGLEMVLGELATLRDLGLPVVIVVFVDASLALIELKQRGRQLPRHGVLFGRTDFPAVAEALGGRGVVADSRESLAGALETAIDDERFTIISCPIDDGAYDGRL